MKPFDHVHEIFESDTSIIYASYNVPLRSYCPYEGTLDPNFFTTLKSHIVNVNPKLAEILESDDMFFRVFFRGADPIDESIPGSTELEAVDSILKYGVEYNPQDQNVGYTSGSIWHNYLIPGGDDIQNLINFPISYILIYEDREYSLMHPYQYATKRIGAYDLKNKLKAVVRLFWWPVLWDDELDYEVPKRFGIELDTIVRPKEYKRDRAKFLALIERLKEEGFFDEN